MSAHSILRYTVEQYLAMDEASEIPLEYYDGQIIPADEAPFVEATYVHAALVPNVCFALKVALTGRDCTVLSYEGYDRGTKFRRYRQIESVKEYALVVQTEPRIELFTREGGDFWSFRVFEGMDAICHFSSLNCSIPVASVYEKVPFTGPGSEAP